MSRQKKALVCGAGGFIGGHLVNRLKEEGYWVRAVDLKENEFGNMNADEFVQGDLRGVRFVEQVVTSDLDEVYQDRKSTRLNSSHVAISYAVFCLKKKSRRGDSGRGWY